MDDSKLCMRCFEPVQDPLACDACGWHRGAPRERDGELAPGSLLRERYYVGRVLGRGGFGITYLGWDTRLRRKRAIKEYFPRGVATRGRDETRMTVVSGQSELLSDGIEKFLTEAQLLARFENHPCIVSPRDFFEENGTAYLVMECLVGETLAHYVQRNGGKIPYGRAMQYLEPVIQALSTLHAAGILHRDVSPENIFLTVEHQPKLLDFGAARQRAPGQSGEMTVILRENYAPPEQYTKAGRQGPWTDVYALGATLYKSITGQHPPRSVDRLMSDALQPPSELGAAIPVRCERALMAAMALRHDERPDIDTLLTELRSDAEDDVDSPVDEPRGAPEALRSALSGAATRAHDTMTRVGQGIAAGAEWIRPHLLHTGLLGAAIAAAVLTLGVLWSGALAPDAVGPVPRETRTTEELESHAAKPPSQPVQEIPQGAARPASEAPALELAPSVGPSALRTPASPSTPASSAEPRELIEPALELARAPLAQPTSAADQSPELPLEPAVTPQTGNPPALTAPTGTALTGAPEKAARLIVRSNVNDDIVEIDGSARGPSGPAGFAVDEGPHKVRVSKAGRKPFEVDIEVARGERKIVNVRLDPDQGSLDQLSQEGLRLLNGAPKDWQQGLRLLQDAAEMGDDEALGTLGELYAYGALASGRGPIIPTNDERALAYHRKAAERGERTAQSRLAHRLEDGRWPVRGESGMPQVGAEKSTLFDRIMGRQAPEFLASLRSNKREGRPADFAEAFRWHKAAAMRGHAGSQKRLGFMYAAGRGVERNEFSALYWFLESARQGEPESQFVAGMCYALGEGYGKNDDAARCWLRRSAAQNYKQAQEELERRGFVPDPSSGWRNAPKVCNFRGP
jgi:serine/threonine protein kinase